MLKLYDKVLKLYDKVLKLYDKVESNMNYRGKSKCKKTDAYADLDLDAVITVEAAFIMPILIFMIIGFMLIAMYIHDVVVTKSIVNLYMEKISLVANNEYDLENDNINYEKQTENNIILDNYKKVFDGDETAISKVSKKIKNEINDNLLWCDIKKVSLKRMVGYASCDVTLSNSFGEYPLMENITKNITISKKVTTISECELIRFVDVYLKKKKVGGE